MSALTFGIRWQKRPVDWVRFASHPTQNTSFWRRSLQAISWLSSETHGLYKPVMWWLWYFLDSISIRFFLQRIQYRFDFSPQYSELKIWTPPHSTWSDPRGVKPILWPAPIAGPSRAIRHRNQVTLTQKIAILILFDLPKKSRFRSR